ncbi:MAG: hypothetical protein RR420_01125 [Anaerovoracaceae bacterium]
MIKQFDTILNIGIKVAAITEVVAKEKAYYDSLTKEEKKQYIKTGAKTTAITIGAITVSAIVIKKIAEVIDEV